MAEIDESNLQKEVEAILANLRKQQGRLTVMKGSIRSRREEIIAQYTELRQAIEYLKRLIGRLGSR